MSGDNRDLRSACLWAIALAIAVILFEGTTVRAVLGLPMVLLISGHTLLRAIGIRADSPVEHLIYAIGASLVAGIAGGFVLNAIGLMTPLGWAIWYLLVVTSASALAIRRFGAAASLPWPRLVPIRAPHAIAFALAALLTTAAYALAVHDEVVIAVLLVDQRRRVLPAALAAGRGEEQRRGALPVVAFGAVGLLVTPYVFLSEQQSHHPHGRVISPQDLPGAANIPRATPAPRGADGRDADATPAASARRITRTGRAAPGRSARTAAGS